MQVLVDQCMFLGSFSKRALVRFMPHGLREDPNQDTAAPVGVTFVVLSMLALISANMVVFSVMQVGSR